MKKLLYIGDPYALECSLFSDLILHNWDVKVVCIGNNLKFTNIFNTIQTLFNVEFIEEKQYQIDAIINYYNPNIILLRCWDSLGNLNIPDSIFYKCESQARQYKEEQLPIILPKNNHKAFLTMVKEEVPDYKKLLTMPVGYLPYGVSKNWEKQGSHEYDIMATGTAIEGFKLQSWELLVKPLCYKYSPTQLHIYQHINKELMPWSYPFLQPCYTVDKAPFSNYKIFMCPIAYRYDYLLSHKLFQAMGSGCLVITQKTPGSISTFGNDGENLIYAESEEEVTLKVDYYLNNQDKLNEIAKRGYEFIHKDYGFYNNFIRALNEIGINP